MVIASASFGNKIPIGLQKFVSALVVASISLYQRYLSPIKGFSCAHRLLHKDESCSAYIKRTLQEQDLMTAISMSRQRFHDCYRASQELSSKISQEEVVHEQVWQGKSKFSKRRKFLLGLLAGLSVPLLTGCLTYREGNEEVCCCCVKTRGLRWEVPEDERKQQQ